MTISKHSFVGLSFLSPLQRGFLQLIISSPQRNNITLSWVRESKTFFIITTSAFILFIFEESKSLTSFFLLAFFFFTRQFFLVVYFASGFHFLKREFLPKLNFHFLVTWLEFFTYFILFRSQWRGGDFLELEKCVWDFCDV